MAAEGFDVECEVLLPPDRPGTALGELVLTVEDVTFADAPSRRVAHRVRPGPHPLAAGRLGPFTVDGVAGGGTLALRVTLDVDGDGAIGVGDMLSTRRHPVGPGSRGVLRVPLTRIGG